MGLCPLHVGRSDAPLAGDALVNPGLAASDPSHRKACWGSPKRVTPTALASYCARNCFHASSSATQPRRRQASIPAPISSGLFAGPR